MWNKFPQSSIIFPLPWLLTDRQRSKGKERARIPSAVEARAWGVRFLHRDSGDWVSNEEGTAPHFLHYSHPFESLPPCCSLSACWERLKGFVVAVVVSINTASFSSSCFPSSIPQWLKLPRDFHGASQTLLHRHRPALNKGSDVSRAPQEWKQKARDNYGTVKCILFSSI